MSKVFYKVLWIKVCYKKSETLCQAEPRDLKRPNHTNTMKISYHFFSSDHGAGKPSVVALATPVPHSDSWVNLTLTILKWRVLWFLFWKEYDTNYFLDAFVGSQGILCCQSFNIQHSTFNIQQSTINNQHSTINKWLLYELCVGLNLKVHVYSIYVWMSQRSYLSWGGTLTCFVAIWFAFGCKKQLSILLRKAVLTAFWG